MLEAHRAARAARAAGRAGPSSAGRRRWRGCRGAAGGLPTSPSQYGDTVKPWSTDPSNLATTVAPPCRRRRAERLRRPRRLAHGARSRRRHRRPSTARSRPPPMPARAIVYTQDWHPPRTPHFVTDGGPGRCTACAARGAPSCTRRSPSTGGFVLKGIGGEDGYSGFTMRDPTTARTSSTGLDELLRDNVIEQVVIVGLALDYCVKATASTPSSAGYGCAVVRRGDGTCRGVTGATVPPLRRSWPQPASASPDEASSSAPAPQLFASWRSSGVGNLGVTRTPSIHSVNSAAAAATRRSTVRPTGLEQGSDDLASSPLAPRADSAAVRPRRSARRCRCGRTTVPDADRGTTAMLASP